MSDTKGMLQKAQVLAALIGIEVLDRHGKESPAIVIMAMVLAARAMLVVAPPPTGTASELMLELAKVANNMLGQDAKIEALRKKMDEALKGKG